MFTFILFLYFCQKIWIRWIYRCQGTFGRLFRRVGSRRNCRRCCNGSCRTHRLYRFDKCLKCTSHRVGDEGSSFGWPWWMRSTFSSYEGRSWCSESSTRWRWWRTSDGSELGFVFPPNSFVPGIFCSFVGMSRLKLVGWDESCGCQGWCTCCSRSWHSIFWRHMPPWWLHWFPTWAWLRTWTFVRSWQYRWY